MEWSIMIKPFSIKVPASTANLGPGFDSVGLALSLYLTLDVEQSVNWEFTSPSPFLEGLPTGESHFIYQIAKQVSDRYKRTIPPCKVTMVSDIPLARGLGSSATAIVAGIELADQLGGLRLSIQEKLLIATELEGHPDNVGASLYGGLVIGSYAQNEVQLLSFKDLPFELVAFIPGNTLLTKESRQVLPEQLPFNVAVEASSFANLLVAALISGDWRMAGEMMEKDLFHQPYRKKLIPNYEQINNMAKVNGAFGVALSGAGPTLLAFVEKGSGQNLLAVAKRSFTDLQTMLLSVDRQGSIVRKNSDSI
jgi:homoserine kinase